MNKKRTIRAWKRCCSRGNPAARRIDMAADEMTLVFLSGNWDEDAPEQLWVYDVTSLVHNQLNLNFCFDGWIALLSERESNDNRRTIR